MFVCVCFCVCACVSVCLCVCVVGDNELVCSRHQILLFQRGHSLGGPKWMSLWWGPNVYSVFVVFVLDSQACPSATPPVQRCAATPPSLRTHTHKHQTSLLFSAVRIVVKAKTTFIHLLYLGDWLEAQIN